MKSSSSSSKKNKIANQKKNSKREAPDPTRTLLLNAIHSANLERVRTVLEEICNASLEAYNIACDRLLVELVDDTSSDPSLDSEWKESELREESEDEKKAVDASKKRRKPLSQRFEICKQCKEEYDVGRNYDDACNWHEGISPL